MMAFIRVGNTLSVERILECQREGIEIAKAER